MDKMPRIKPLDQPPKIWQVIEKMDKNGKPMKFTIQEIPEDRYEDAIQHMYTYFLADEPTCECYDAKNDPLFVEDVRKVWRIILEEGISIAAFIENPNGGKPIIAGMNVLGVEIKNQTDFPIDQLKSEKCKNTFRIMTSATKMVYEYYGVDKYLNAIGLSVHPDYRGYGLGKDILKIRYLIGPMYGIPVTCTAFTSIISQKSAASVGFEEMLTKNYADIVDEDGKEYYPGIKSKVLKVMGKRLS